MTKLTLCPVCGEGHLHSKVTKVERELNGKHGSVDLHMSECDFCGADIASGDDLKKNARSMNAFRKKCLGLLSGVELTEIRKRLSINQKQAAAIFGASEKDYSKFSKYEKNDVVQSVAMDKLIRVASVHENVFIELCEAANVNARKITLHKTIESTISINSQKTGLWSPLTPEMTHRYQ